MVFEPRDEDSVVESLRNRLTGKIAELTNFTEGSFNDVWTTAFSQGLREKEIQALAAQLSGFIEYSGGPITQSDLDDLDIEDVTPEEINEYMEDEDLDELVNIVGISRDQGTEATGEVEFTTVTATTTIPAGTSVGTEPDSNGDFLEFETDEEAETATGDTTVLVDVTATDVGSEFNVGAPALTFLPDPPVGVQEVTNNTSPSGGEDPETNDELRSRAQDAVFATSGGGTTDGIIGYIEQNTDAADVVIDEFTSQQPPNVDVIVDGGTDSEINDAIDFSKPTGIEHNLVRPTIYSIELEVDVTGTDIDTSRIEEDLTDLIGELGIGDNFFRDKVFQIVFNGDEDVENTTRLDVFISSETHTFSNGTFVYALDKGDEMDLNEGIVEIDGTSGGSSRTFVEGADYEEDDDSGNGDDDAVNFDLPLLTGAVADDGGAQTTETSEANDDTSDDMTLLPSSPAVGDAYYFAGPNEFDGLDLNISTAGDGTWSLSWEYWDGSAWSSLSNVTDDTGGFQNSGKNSVTFDEPSDWETTTVNGISGEFWIRASVGTFSSINTQPLGQKAHLGREPDDSTDFHVDYEMADDITFESREKASPGTMTVTVV